MVRHRCRRTPKPALKWTIMTIHLMSTCHRIGIIIKKAPMALLPHLEKSRIITLIGRRKSLKSQ